VEADVTVDIGDTVTWHNEGGFHNVKFDDGSFEQPADVQSDNWTVSRTFNSAGSFGYYCEAHGAPNGVGMSGTVTVNSGDTVPSTDPPPGTDTVPGPGPPPGTDTSPSPTPAPDTTGSVISRFSMTRALFRVGRGRNGGSAFRFQL
jgi:hypothetical protein